MHHPRGLRPGFSLLEVMIVIVIILAILGFVGANLMGQRDKANERLVKAQLLQLKQSLMNFKNDFDRFPTDEEGLVVLWDKTAIPEEEQSKWSAAYTSEPIPVDRWNSAWGYKQVGERAPEGWFDLWSFGPDKQDGTTDDIHLWDARSDSGTDPLGGPPSSREGSSSPPSGTSGGN
ncbi:MAG: type II secretion system major pseudopilin GspG [Phycisphaerales bacterium]